VREAATRKLIELGEGVRPLVEATAKEKNLDPEMAERIKTIIAAIDKLHWAVLIGKVVDENGKPVKDAKVRAFVKDLQPAAAEGVATKADGTFVLPVPPGQYQSVLAEAQGGEASGEKNGPFKVRNGETRDVGTIKMLSEPVAPQT
jgi:hypothetical protein